MVQSGYVCSMKTGKLNMSDIKLTDYERVEDAYSRAFVLCMGVRCPTKHNLIQRFYGYLETSGNDNMIPLDDAEIINAIPKFIDHLASI